MILTWRARRTFFFLSLPFCSVRWLVMNFASFACLNYICVSFFHLFFVLFDDVFCTCDHRSHAHECTHTKTHTHWHTHTRASHKLVCLLASTLLARIKNANKTWSWPRFEPSDQLECTHISVLHSVWAIVCLLPCRWNRFASQIQSIVWRNFSWPTNKITIM